MITIQEVKLYTLVEIADLLGVTRSTISHYISRGRLRATPIGRKKYVTEENFKQFLQASQVNA